VESSFFRVLALLKLYTGLHIYSEFLNIPPKILRGAAKTYFRENHGFPKKGCQNMGV
jgi:hypothetical protein